MTVLSLEGFIKDFVGFFDRPLTAKRVKASVNGFTERVVRVHVWQHWDIAHVLVALSGSLLATLVIALTGAACRTNPVEPTPAPGTCPARRKT